MRSRQEIRAELIEANPVTNVGGILHGPGDAIYELLMEQWVDAKEARLAITPASRKIWPSASAFLSEFTMPELSGIELSLDPTIAALRLLLASWPADIYSDDPRIVGGLSALVGAGIITELSRAEILAK